MQLARASRVVAAIVMSIAFAASAQVGTSTDSIGSPATQPATQPASQPAIEPTTRPTLKIGDVAPPLNVDRWIKGKPVAAFEPGKIYVVDFWATWCGPCVASIPDMTFLQAKYPDVTFIGVDVEERDAAIVEPFVRQMGKRMDFRVAADLSPGDNAPGPVYDAWMFSPAGKRGLPDSFVIDGDGKVLLTTHPTALAGLLKAVVEKRFDRDVYARTEAERGPLWTRFDSAWQRKDFAAARIALDGLMAVSPYDPKYAYAIQRLFLLSNSGDLAGAAAWYDQIVRGADDGDVVPSLLDEAYLARLDLLRAQGDAAGLNAHLVRLRTRYADDGDHLNALAWELVEDKAGQGFRALPVDWDLVLAIANDANIAATGQDANALDTLARVHAIRGEFELAARTEALAVDLVDAKEARQKRATFEKTLAAYRAGREE